MGRYKFNLFEGAVTNNEEHRTHGFGIGARIKNTLLGHNRDKTWNGSRFVRSEIYDVMSQTGGWDYDGGWGLFKSPTTYGTTGSFFLATSGRLATRFLTAAGANNPAGVRVPVLITRRSIEPVLVYSVLSGDTANTKHFHGFTSYTTQVPVGAGVTNPLGSSDAGFMIGFISGGNFKIYNNDATGAPPTPTDTGIAVTASTLYQFGIELQDAGAKGIWSISNLNTNPPTPLGSGEVTTRLPPITTSMAPHWHAESVGAGQINLYLPTARIFQRG